MIRVYLALGGNLGDRRGALRSAVEGLKALLEIDAISPVYETPAAYVVDQPPFLNMAVGGRTTLPATALLSGVKQLEIAIGRVASVRRGPRLIDIDIVFYGDETIEETDLKIPHPLLAERAFVLAPLANIAPDRPHPITGLSVRDMFEKLSAAARGEVRNVGALGDGQSGA